MANLTSEFMQGYQARMAAGRCLEHGNPACPFIATSPAGDAFAAGVAHASNTLAGASFGGVDAVRCWHGRGDRVNVENRTPRHGKARVVYLVNYPRHGAPFATLES